MPDIEVAHRILLLNTEKAHNLRERSLEVIRLAELLAESESRPEKDYEIEFEEPALLTLGLCYQENGRFAGGAYHPILRRVEKWQSAALPKALETRRERAARILELDAAVSEAMKALKERGFESPYLRPFVVARINPIRFKKGPADADETIDTMLAAAKRFDAGTVRATRSRRPVARRRSSTAPLPATPLILAFPLEWRPFMLRHYLTPSPDPGCRP